MKACEPCWPEGDRVCESCGASGRLRRFAEDAWRELEAVGRDGVFLHGYLSAEAEALGIGRRDGR